MQQKLMRMSLITQSRGCVLLVIEDLKNFPKKLLKNKDITFYKAFCPEFIKPGEEEYPELKVRTDIEVLAITKEDAVAELIRNGYPENDFLEKEIIFVEVTLFTDELKKIELIDSGEPFFENGTFPITLKTKKYLLDVSNQRLTNFKVDIGENERKIVSEITLMKI